LRVLLAGTLVALVVGALLAAASIGPWRTLEQERIDALDASVRTELALARRLIEKEYFEIAGDVAVASRAPAVVDFAVTGSPLSRRAAEALMTEIVASYRRYPHVRLVDLTGRETLRIDRTPEGAEAAALATRPAVLHAELVQDVLARPAGTMVVIGLIDAPAETTAEPVPTIRAAVPVTADERTVALLVIDYEASELLAEIAAVFRASAARDVWVGPPRGFVALAADVDAPGGGSIPPRPLTELAPEVADALATGADRPVDATGGRLYQDRTELTSADRSSEPSAAATGRLTPAAGRAGVLDWRLIARVPAARIAAVRPWNDRGLRLQVLLTLGAVGLLSLASAASFEALRGARRRAERDALIDALTGAGNRRAFQAELVRDVARAQRSGTPLALTVLDLDRFKRINDRYGHAGGDAVLRAFVAMARSTLRSGDAVYRIGGEEFALILPDSDRDAARQGVERLRAAMAASPVPWQDGTIAYGASFGVVAAAPDALRGAPSKLAEALLSFADDAAYAAKRAGRGGVEVVDAPPPAASA
jgi:diguanylate cyclase (GGDEF)-like protein